MNNSSYELFVTLASVAYKAKEGGGSISGINEVDLLAQGAIAVFIDDPDHTMIASNAAADAHASAQEFFFAIGMLTGKPSAEIHSKRSKTIRKDGLQVIKKNYAAPAKKNIKVGYNSGTATGSLNLPSTLVVGSVATLKVYRENNETVGSPLDGNMQNRGLMVDSILVSDYVRASDTADTLIARIVASINAHPNNTGSKTWVTASVLGTSGAGTLAINLAGQLNYQDFNVAKDDILANATVTVTTELDYGHGASVQVAEMETHARVIDGETNRVHLPTYYFNQPIAVVAGATYTTYTFRWNAKTGIPSPYTPSTEMEFVIAVPDADTIETNIDTILAALDITVLNGDTW